MESIASVDIPVCLDFAGGDPLYLKTDIEVIRQAGKIFGSDNIDISTTGLSLSKLDDEALRKLARGYALTYDFPRELENLDSCHSNGYNSLNYEQAVRLRHLGIPVEITLPVRRLSEDVTLRLVDDLMEIMPNEIILLRMMSLGNNRSQESACMKTEAERLIKLLRAHKYGGRVDINCAFRERCMAMTSSKFGLDDRGNLFGCIWAADLDVPLSENRFYLGNLLDESLIEVLQRNSSRIANLRRDCCYVVEQSLRLS